MCIRDRICFVVVGECGAFVERERTIVITRQDRADAETRLEPLTDTACHVERQLLFLESISGPDSDVVTAMARIDGDHSEASTRPNGKRIGWRRRRWRCRRDIPARSRCRRDVDRDSGQAIVCDGCGPWHARGPAEHERDGICPVSYTHLRAHETPEHLVC